MVGTFNVSTVVFGIVVTGVVIVVRGVVGVVVSGVVVVTVDFRVLVTGTVRASVLICVADVSIVVVALDDVSVSGVSVSVDSDLRLSVFTVSVTVLFTASDFNVLADDESSGLRSVLVASLSESLIDFTLPSLRFDSERAESPFESSDFLPLSPESFALSGSLAAFGCWGFVS